MFVPAGKQVDTIFVSLAEPQPTDSFIYSNPIFASHILAVRRLRVRTRCRGMTLCWASHLLDGLLERQKILHCRGALPLPRLELALPCQGLSLRVQAP